MSENKIEVKTVEDLPVSNSEFVGINDSGFYDKRNLLHLVVEKVMIKLLSSEPRLQYNDWIFPELCQKEIAEKLFAITKFVIQKEQGTEWDYMKAKIVSYAAILLEETVFVILPHNIEEKLRAEIIRLYYCCGCDTKMPNFNFEAYTSKQGHILIDGQRYWINVVCKKCGKTWALHEVTKREGLNDD